MEGRGRGLVHDGAGVGVDAHHVALRDRVAGLGAFHDGEADVDGVAVEDAREALRDDHADARRLDSHRGVLARAAAAEVLVRHDDVAGARAADEAGVEVLQAVPGELCRVRGVEVAGGDDDVGVDVTPIAKHGSLELHVFRSFRHG